jgi:hypothetical protein
VKYALIQSRVSTDEEVLVFQCIISQLPSSTNAASSTKPSPGTITNEQNNSSHSVIQPTSGQQEHEPMPPSIQVNESTGLVTTTQPSQVTSDTPTLSAQPPPIQSARISTQTSAAAQQAIPQQSTQLSSNPPPRLNVQVVPIQYQALLLKSIIFCY